MTSSTQKPLDESRGAMAVIGWVIAAALFWAGVGTGLLLAGCVGS